MSSGIYFGLDFFRLDIARIMLKNFRFKKNAKEPSDLQKIHSDEDRQIQC